MTRRVTISDVAARAGVSTMTVSRVVNGTGRVSEATRQKVNRVIRQLGYEPNMVARGLTTRQSQTIGIVLPDITNPFFPRSEEHTSELQSRGHLVCRLLLEKRK